ncbi:Essential recombination function protein [uncultured Caudovirales phage]|uniref:Essential recombination function protein n=1 Tax=uncultured Caudovirales phage TaxID=2100421 RepID=A0A6J7WYN6_9CAUD|nr:Essential recombination function protein [uncultured Caudovirales phage]
MNVYQKLNAARAKFHSIELKKSGHNKFAGYKYFELGDFIIPALEIFKEHGLTGIISFGKETADLRIVNNEKPEEMIVIESPMSSAALKGCHEVQNLGAVQTYLRRYLWVAALEIVEHDAIDSAPAKEKVIITPSQGIADNIPPEEMQYLQELAIELIANVAEGNPKQALERLDAEKLEAEQKVALWSLLDSKTRSAIKKAKE